MWLVVKSAVALSVLVWPYWWLLRIPGPAMEVDLSAYPAEDVARARAWPKVELHLHLDGSLSPAFIARRAAARGIELPAPEER